MCLLILIWIYWKLLHWSHGLSSPLAKIQGIAVFLLFEINLQLFLFIVFSTFGLKTWSSVLLPELPFPRDICIIEIAYHDPLVFFSQCDQCQAALFSCHLLQSSYFYPPVTTYALAPWRCWATCFWFTFTFILPFCFLCLSFEVVLDILSYLPYVILIFLFYLFWPKTSLWSLVCGLKKRGQGGRSHLFSFFVQSDCVGDSVFHT